MFFVLSSFLNAFDKTALVRRRCGGGVEEVWKRKSGRETACVLYEKLYVLATLKNSCCLSDICKSLKKGFVALCYLYIVICLHTDEDMSRDV